MIEELFLKALPQLGVGVVAIGAIYFLASRYIESSEKKDDNLNKIITEHMIKEAEAFSKVTDRLEAIPEAFEKFSKHIDTKDEIRTKVVLAAIKRRRKNGNGKNGHISTSPHR